jgi:hypothetical protein
MELSRWDTAVDASGGGEEVAGAEESSSGCVWVSVRGEEGGEGGAVDVVEVSTTVLEPATGLEDGAVAAASSLEVVLTGKEAVDAVKERRLDAPWCVVV